MSGLNKAEWSVLHALLHFGESKYGRHNLATRYLHKTSIVTYAHGDGVSKKDVLTAIESLIRKGLIVQRGTTQRYIPYYLNVKES